MTYDVTNNPGQATISGNLSLGGTQAGTGLSGAVTRTFTVNDSTNVAAGTAELLVSAVVSDGTLGTGSTGDGLIKAGAGTMQLSNTANTYTGATTINAGTLQVTKLADGGLTSSIGDSTNGAANLVINGGTLSYIGSGATNGTTNRQFTIGTSGGTLDASGAAGSPMVFMTTTSPTLSGTNAARTLTLTGTNTDANTLSAGLSNNGTGATSLVKNGAGTWVLTGDSSAGATPMTGATTVNGGLLLVNNTAGSGTGSGAVTVNSTATLGGNGTIAGNLTVNAGGILSPGSTAGLNSGTLNLGGDFSMAGNASAETRLAFGYTNATGNVGNAWISANGANWWNAYTGALLTGNGGQSNDLVNLTASTGTPTLTWDTGGKITLSQLGSPYSWVMGDVLNLLDWTSLYNAGGNISGTFDANADFDLPTLGSGLAWDTSRFVSTGAIAVIPEPSRAMLLLFGLLGLTFFRRRR